MWLGTMKHSSSKILDFKSIRDPIKVLGAFLSYNQNKNVEENFSNKIRIKGLFEATTILHNEVHASV